MEIRQLRYFKTLCQERSYSKAAAQLFITQQGLSRSIQMLESELQTPLIIRNTTPLVLSPEGEYLLQRCNVILDEVDETVDAFLRVSSLADTVLSVVAPITTLKMLPENFHSSFSQAYPDMTLSISDAPEQEGERMVLDGEAQIALSAYPVDTNKFHVVPLMEQPLYAVLNNDHPLAKQLEVSVDDLCKYGVTVIESRFKSNQIFHEACKRRGLIPASLYTAASSLTLFQIARETNSAGITFKHLSKIFHSENMSYIRIKDEDMRFRICLITLKGRTKSKACNAYISNAFNLLQQQ